TVNAVTPPNTAPVAYDDNYSVDQDDVLNVTAPGVLDNDTDAESDPLTAVLVDSPQNGTLTLNSDGSFTYEPNAGYSGPDSFTYKANDGADDSNAATVSITVNAVTPPNTAPVAYDDNYSVDQDDVLNVTAPGVLDNDTDAENDALTVIVEDTPQNGTLSLNSDGSFTYEPNAGYSGRDSFTYKANDDADDSNVASVNITVNAVTPPNTAPVAYDDSYSVDQDDVLNVTAPGVLDNDTDVEDDALTVVVEDSPQNGTLSLNSDGSFTYEPNAGYSGPDSFTYIANDGTDDSNVATVRITVNAVTPGNTAPVANDDNYSVDQDDVLIVIAPGVLDNDKDAEDDALTAILEDSPQNGTLSLNSDGSFTYEPNAGYSGPDSFTYKANDGSDDSNVATVNITVNAVTPPNTAPVANDDSYAVDQDDVLNVTAPGVLDNDTDVENDALTAIVEESPQNGTLSLNSDGSFTYEPKAGYSGPDSFTYIANDGADDSNVATVRITVNAITPGNTAPVANDDNYSVDQDDVLTVIAPGVLDNDTDAEDDALTAILADSPQNGTLNIKSDGSFTYEPNAGYSGPDSFTYIANDGSDDSNVATVRITVNSLSEDFQCIETPINLQLNQSGSANVTLNDLYSGDATGLNLVASQLEFNCEDIGENVIELSWTGERSGSCEITVVVEDNMQPTAKVTFISVILDENGIAEIAPEDLDNGSSDNCGEVIFSVSKSRFTCEDTGQNTVSLTLTDPSGNSTSLNTIVFVNANPGSCTEPPRDNDYVFLYPNPTDGLVKISTPQDITVEQVFVFDKRGRFILSKAFDKSDQEYELQIDGVQNAVYTLRIITNEDEIIRRLIIRN
ncbi:Ig-like domain-containing protein, partial [Salegentibacter sp. F14]